MGRFAIGVGLFLILKMGYGDTRSRTVGRTRTSGTTRKTLSSSWRCYTCQREFGIRSLFDVHLAANGHEGFIYGRHKYRCNRDINCGFSSYTYKDIQRHERFEHRVMMRKRLDCMGCGKEQPGFPELAYHMAKCFNLSYCSVCGLSQPLTIRHSSQGRKESVNCMILFRKHLAKHFKAPHESPEVGMRKREFRIELERSEAIMRSAYEVIKGFLEARAEQGVPSLPRGSARVAPKPKSRPKRNKTVEIQIPKKIDGHTSGILKKWFDEALVYPYPSPSEREILRKETGLSEKQIIQWFINRRRRDKIQRRMIRSREKAMESLISKIQNFIKLARDKRNLKLDTAVVANKLTEMEIMLDNFNGTVRRKASERTRRKIAESMKMRWKDDRFRKRLTAGMREKWQDPIYRKFRTKTPGSLQKLENHPGSANTELSTEHSTEHCRSPEHSIEHSTENLENTAKGSRSSAELSRGSNWMGDEAVEVSGASPGEGSMGKDLV
ncbi:hypothetical protein AAMO2058_001052700 [Amorphochlora amoebiformis]